MKTILLDAYNVIHKIPELKAKLRESLYSARRQLVLMMVNWKVKNGFNGGITVVFDGQDNISSSEGSKLHGIKCLFTTSKEEADDRIISIVRETPAPSKLLVITDDGRVRNSCKALGAQIKYPSYLLEQKKRKKPFNPVESRSKSTLKSSEEKEVDDYYKKMLGLD